MRGYRHPLRAPASAAGPAGRPSPARSRSAASARPALRRRPGRAPPAATAANWASSPATSGPTPMPPRLAAVATTCGRRPVGDPPAPTGCSSARYAVAVPVVSPTDTPETTRATMQARQARKGDEQHRAEHVEGERGHQDPTSAHPVRDVAAEEQAGDHAKRVDRVDDGDHERGEVVAVLVDDVQRRRNGRERQIDAEGGRHDPERRRVAPPGPGPSCPWPVRTPGSAAVRSVCAVMSAPSVVCSHRTSLLWSPFEDRRRDLSCPTKDSDETHERNELIMELRHLEHFVAVAEERELHQGRPAPAPRPVGVVGLHSLPGARAARVAVRADHA